MTPNALPGCCDECEYFSGDGFNDCCKHPEYIDDGFNMNAQPGRCRMVGCPFDAKQHNNLKNEDGTQ